VWRLRPSSLLTSDSFAVDGLSFVCWAQAESAICIIAASIPHLRILLRELPNLHSQTPFSTHITQPTQPNNSWRQTSITSISQGCAERPAIAKMTDNGSDKKSILNYDIEMNGLERSSIVLRDWFALRLSIGVGTIGIIMRRLGLVLNSWGLVLRRRSSDIQLFTPRTYVSDSYCSPVSETRTVTARASEFEDKAEYISE